MVSARSRIGDAGRVLAHARETVGHAARALRPGWRSSPARPGAPGGLTVVNGVAPLGVAYAAKHIVDEIVARDASAAACWVLVELACVAAMATGQRGVALLRSVLGARLGLDLGSAIL